MFSSLLSKAFFPATRSISTQAIKNILFSEQSIIWEKTTCNLVPFETKIGNATIKLRLNDFPEEPLYSVLHEGKKIIDVNGFEANWAKAGDVVSKLPGLK